MNLGKNIRCIKENDGESDNSSNKSTPYAKYASQFSVQMLAEFRRDYAPCHRVRPAKKERDTNPDLRRKT